MQLHTTPVQILLMSHLTVNFVVQGNFQPHLGQVIFKETHGACLQSNTALSVPLVFPSHINLVSITCLSFLAK